MRGHIAPVPSRLSCVIFPVLNLFIYKPSRSSNLGVLHNGNKRNVRTYPKKEQNLPADPLAACMFANSCANYRQSSMNDQDLRFGARCGCIPYKRHPASTQCIHDRIRVQQKVCCHFAQCLCAKIADRAFHSLPQIWRLLNHLAVVAC